MKLVNFKISVFAIAIGLVIASCGDKSKQEGETSEIEKVVEGVAALSDKNISVSHNWESNEYTKLLPKPEMAINVAVESNSHLLGGIRGYVVNFDNPTLEQVKAYVAKLKAAGFNDAAFEGTINDTYSFHANNASGWRVMVSWSQDASTLMISNIKEIQKMTGKEDKK